jgi:hypothetical protein
MHRHHRFLTDYRNGAVTVVMECHQRSAIIEQTQLRALPIDRTRAALSDGYLLSCNGITLEQAMWRTG